jgi:hypothetical protein
MFFCVPFFFKQLHDLLWCFLLVLFLLHQSSIVPMEIAASVPLHFGARSEYRYCSNCTVNIVAAHPAARDVD